MDLLKETLEREYVVLATSLSPGSALAALMSTNDTRFKDLSVADISMPISKQKLQNVHLEEEIPQVKRKSKFVKIHLKEQVKKETNLKDERAIAIADLFERKRREYHEQGREEIKRHLLRSKQRLAKLEKTLKLSNHTKITQKKEGLLPLHLQSGAKNNFKVDESLKSCWYDKVAEAYLMKRGNYRKAKGVTHATQIVQSHGAQKKCIKDSVPLKKSFLDNVLDSPEMGSLSTPIQMNDETIYYYTKYDQGFHHERIDRKLKYKQVMDQINRAKEVTLNGLVRNGINIFQTVDSETVEEENVLINILEDDELAEDEKEKSVQRKKSLVSKKSFTELTNNEKILARRSFILDRSNSRISRDHSFILGDARPSVCEDDGVTFGLNQSFNQQTNLNASFRKMSIRNPQITEKVEKVDSLSKAASSDNVDCLLPSDIVVSLSDSVGAQKTKTEKVIEPLTWEEMVQLERPRVTGPEKVPLMKWQNPKFN